MGFFFRKRFRVCKGLDLNLSKNGVGISAGIKGLRISRSAKGDTYLNAGTGGLYYRKKLNGFRKSTEPVGKMTEFDFILILGLIILLAISMLGTAFFCSEVLKFGLLKTMLYSFIIGISSPFVIIILFLAYCVINGVYEYCKMKKKEKDKLNVENKDL